MYIVNPLSAGAASNLFSTHPPVDERIRRLRAYDQPMRPKAVARPQQARGWGD